jgi:hypothetical protein
MKVKGIKGLLAFVSQPEELPFDPGAPAAKRPSLLSTLLAPESLPREEAGPRPEARRSFLAMLFAREHLPRESGTGARDERGGPPAG